MITLLSPAKTLDFENPSPTNLCTKPDFLDFSNDLIKGLSTLSCVEIESLMGISPKLAQLNHDKAEYLKTEFKRADFRIPFESPIFNEFVVEFPAGFKKTYQRLLKKKIIAGLPMDGFYPELKNHYLLCVTETNTRADMDALVQEIKK